MKKIVVAGDLIFLVVLFIFPQEKNKRKFQFEIYGGFSSLNPEHLNLRIEAEEKIAKFWYDDYYTFLEDNNQILSYRKNREGKFKKIKYGIPLGLRLKYYLKKSLAISLGIKYISKEQNSYVNDRYTITDDSGYEYISRSEYSPFTLSAAGYMPMLGIHYAKKISGALEIEGFITGGPLFAACRCTIEQKDQQISSDGIILNESVWMIEEKGKGSGVAWEGGARINIKIGNRIHFFVEGGYALQKVNRLSGPGSENRNGITETWEGNWGLKEYGRGTYWGNLYTLYPSNHWQPDEEPLRARNFELDLSGLQMRIGVSYQF